jgi:methylmalonyl-CoA epimerase
VFERVHHVGQLVEDIDRTAAFYESVLGAETTATGDVDGKVEVAFLEVAGTATELIARHERGTYLDDLLDAHLEASAFHVAYTVPDIAAAMAVLEDAGYPMFDEEPVGGLGPYVRAFPDPRAVPGIPIELVELRPD